MNITTKTSLMGFLMTLSAFSVSTTTATTATTATPQTIEGRLTRLTSIIRERTNQLPIADQPNPEQLVARGFADGSGREWVNGRGGNGWADGNGGGWANVNPWRNGWADGNGFVNWRDS